MGWVPGAKSFSIKSAMPCCNCCRGGLELASYDFAREIISVLLLCYSYFVTIAATLHIYYCYCFYYH